MRLGRPPRLNSNLIVGLLYKFPVGLGENVGSHVQVLDSSCRGKNTKGRDWHRALSSIRLRFDKQMVYKEDIRVRTKGHRDLQDLTEQVEQIVSRSGVSDGIVHVFNVGSTAAVGTIEFEPGLAADLPSLLDRLIPPSREYGHEQMWHDGNGHSHLQATWLGPELTVPLAGQRLTLGTWQQIFHLECDVKPRERRVVVTVIGE